MTGSAHPKHRSARSPRPTPEGRARDNPIAGPRTGTTWSEPSAPASAGASGRHNEPGSQPTSACPAQPPSKGGGASPRGGERHHGDGKADQSTESNKTRRGRRTNAGPRGKPERRAAGHNHGTRTGAKPQRPLGAANPGSAHNTQRTAAQEQVPGNSQPTHHKPHPGVAGRSQNQSPSTHTHNAHPSQEWRGTGGARTAAHTHPKTPARSCGAQPKPEPEHTYPRRTHQPGVAGYKLSASTSTHTAQQPSQEWRGAAETRAQAHTPTPYTSARSGGVQAEQAHKHTHTPTPQPGVAERSQNLSPNTHTHTAHPS